MSKACRVVRVRIESRAIFTWFGFKTPRTEYRAMVEEHFMSWKDYYSSSWLSSREKAVEAGNDWLDDISSGPSGEYI